MLEPAGYVRLVWRRKVSSTEVRELLNQALQLLETSHCGRMLIDHRQAEPYSEEDCNWLVRDWFPRCMHHTNYGYGAVLASYDLFVQLAVSSFGQYVRQQFGIQYHYFEADQEADAIDWLVAQPATLHQGKQVDDH
jgi:hypothetical protein